MQHVLLLFKFDTSASTSSTLQAHTRLVMSLYCGDVSLTLGVCQSRSAKILTQAVCQHVVSSCSHQNPKFGMLYKTHLTFLYNQLIAKSIEVLSWRQVRLGSAAWAARLAQEIEIV